MEHRIRNSFLRSRVMSADEAQEWIRDGMTVGVSGFTRCGDVKAVPRALVNNIRKTGDLRRIHLYSGASLGEADSWLSSNHLVDRRSPYQSDPETRKSINRGEIRYIEQHLSHTAESFRDGNVGPIDLAIVEAVAITEDGGIIPTTSVGNSPLFVQQAKQVIVEINLSMPESLIGIHDIYLPERRPFRSPIDIRQVDDLIGYHYIPCDPEKIIGIVITDEPDSPSRMIPPDEETQQMAGYILELLEHEVRHGRLTDKLAPLQSGVGSVANAVFSGLEQSPFNQLEIYTEVMQDSVFHLFDSGKVAFASGCSFSLSQRMRDHVLSSLPQYRNQIVLRPQEISNHPEVIRRLGVIAMNAALEIDIYGNVNSTHVLGTHMMNGIGGSGDFARNAGLTIFVTKSTAKNGKVSSIVPFVSHVDHTEHDVDILVTEQGIADLRGLSPRERAKVIIENLSHPFYKDALRDYFQRASVQGGHTPHLLEEALSWHRQFKEAGDMRKLEPSVL
ncbi:succinyl-CoA:acetate CoA-transferase [Melghirimyces profundicolus]|uniref:Succinyl-CoA:acetate CoA-transferase n=1 Tax=Melghirimyces profundicolus TaxID=1242148 RepID=A0A2T6AY48_9BACL|nr:succinate CoA transferase [Melghirimyces profundicolus]PTX48719.1 succinyl-CoA:acetate CoA-transferase [Melghirimyces profundicolus]